MNNATVFSQSRSVVFAKPVARDEIEGILKEFLGGIGSQLAVDKVIVGHIKMIACLSAKEDFIFFSQTTADRIDVKFSPLWNSFEERIYRADLDINVLIFGHSLKKVKLVVASSLRQLNTKHGKPTVLKRKVLSSPDLVKKTEKKV